MIHARQSPFGATPIDADRTRFRLWAPKQAHVDLLLGDDAAVPMRRTDDGWFEVEAACGPGAAYRYRLGSGETIPDPVSRAQLGSVHDASVVVDPVSYQWRHAGWRGRPWHETVLYELHPGLFGGYAGIRDELRRLADLGVTAIELMPIADFPGTRNWGYDGVLHYAPARSYGTPDDLKALIDEAHGLGLMVFLDVVYNHFGPDGNYIAACAPEFFRHDVATPWGAAIDFRQPEVRRFFTGNALTWLMDYRFDGLRLDAVHAIVDQDWLVEMARDVRAAIEPGRHVHLVLENDANSAALLTGGFDAQWNDDAHHILHVMLTGEADGYYADYATNPAQRLARCLAEGFDYQGDASAHRGGAARGEPSGALPPTAFVLFLQNHDQVGNRPFGDRLITLADPDALKAAVSLQLLCPHIPLIFMGEELGSTVPFQFFTDHSGALADAVREGRRREFASFKGFDGGSEIPDPNDAQTFERCRLSNQAPDPGWVELYRRLLALRREVVVPRLPGIRSVGAQPLSDAAVLARWRTQDGEVLTIAANLGAEPCALPPTGGRLLFASREAAAQDMLAPRSTRALLGR